MTFLFENVTFLKLDILKHASESKNLCPITHENIAKYASSSTFEKIFILLTKHVIVSNITESIKQICITIYYTSVNMKTA